MKNLSAPVPVHPATAKHALGWKILKIVLSIFVIFLGNRKTVKRRVIQSGYFYFDEKGNPVNSNGDWTPMGTNKVF
ncbi:MAG: hypothetical protein LBH31_05270 [Burkholderiaceae bacterium]|nr:hypothetical protein [Burkholderiaceae bacterium]